MRTTRAIALIALATFATSASSAAADAPVGGQGVLTAPAPPPQPHIEFCTDSASCADLKRKCAHMKNGVFTLLKSKEEDGSVAVGGHCIHDGAKP